MKKVLIIMAVVLGGIFLPACGKEDNAAMNAASHNSIEYDPNASSNQAPVGAAALSFDSFDGGGPEFNVIVDDECIVSYVKKTRYKDAGPANIDGAGKEIVIIFTGGKPGQTNVKIEERSPIGDNLDHLYKVTVDDDLDVSIEEISK